MTPRDAKIGIRDGHLKYARRGAKLPFGGSEFQKRVAGRYLRIVDQYLVGQRTVVEIADAEGIRHQRVSQILKIAINGLLQTGAIRAASVGAKAKRPVHPIRFPVRTKMNHIPRGTESVPVCR